MRKLQKAIIEEMGVQPRIDPAQEVQRRVQLLCDYAAASHCPGFVLGISASTVSASSARMKRRASWASSSSACTR
jgi:NAD+ synthase